MNKAPFILLAPMEGVMDFVLRDMFSALGGMDRLVTEFVRVTDRLLPDHVFFKYCPELQTGGRTRSGHPVFVQLLGGQTGPLADNAFRLKELGAPGVDFNFGCPAKTVNRHDGGATLLKNPHRLFDILSAVKAAVSPLPVTAKVRLGYDSKSYVAEIAQAVNEAGAAALTVHARTKIEGYAPPAHWEFIRIMKEFVHIPVIANGDIWSVEDYFRCKEISGCSDVALGRGLMARPSLALEIKQACQNSISPSKDWNWAQKQWLPEFLQKSRSFRGEKYAVPRMKQILKFMSRHYPEAKLLFEEIKQFMCYDEVEGGLHGQSQNIHLGILPLLHSSQKPAQ